MSYHLCEKPRKFFGPRKFYDRYCTIDTGVLSLWLDNPLMSLAFIKGVSLFNQKYIYNSRV